MAVDNRLLVLLCLLALLCLKDVKVYVGQWRTALLRATQLPSSGILKEVLSALEPQVKQVIDTMSFSHQEIMGALSDRIRISQVSKENLVDSMRAIKSSPGQRLGL